jgi:hypothetical protein
MNINNLVERIATTEARYGGKMQPSCDAGEIATMSFNFKRTFGVAPPDDYIELLSLADGILFNGVEVYGSKTRPSANKKSVKIRSIFEANRSLRIDRGENMQSMVVFAYSEMDLWVYDLDTKLFKRHSHSGDDIEKFKTFEAMITRAFESRLPKE